jgi:hypothetical protein
MTLAINEEMCHGVHIMAFDKEVLTPDIVTDVGLD